MIALRLPRGERFAVEGPALLEEAFRKVDAFPFAGAVVLPPQAIGTADTRVYHGLGRALTGYLLARAPSDVRLFDGAGPEATDPANFVTLRLSTAATVTIVAF